MLIWKCFERSSDFTRREFYRKFCVIMKGCVTLIRSGASEASGATISLQMSVPKKSKKLQKLAIWAPIES